MGRLADIRMVGIVHPSIAIAANQHGSNYGFPLRKAAVQTTLLRTDCYTSLTCHAVRFQAGRARWVLERLEKKNLPATPRWNEPTTLCGSLPARTLAPVQPSRSKPEISIQPIMTTANTSSRRTAQQAHCERDSTASHHEQGFDASSASAPLHLSTSSASLCRGCSPRYPAAGQRHLSTDTELEACANKNGIKKFAAFSHREEMTRGKFQCPDNLGSNLYLRVPSGSLHQRESRQPIPMLTPKMPPWNWRGHNPG